MDNWNVIGRFDFSGLDGEPHGKKSKVRNVMSVHTGEVVTGGVAARQDVVNEDSSLFGDWAKESLLDYIFIDGTNNWHLTRAQNDLVIDENVLSHFGFSSVNENKVVCRQGDTSSITEVKSGESCDRVCVTVGKKNDIFRISLQSPLFLSGRLRGPMSKKIKE